MDTLIIDKTELKRTIDVFPELDGVGMVRRYDYYRVDDKDEKKRILCFLESGNEGFYLLHILDPSILDKWGWFPPCIELRYKQEGFKEHLTKCFIEGKLPIGPNRMVKKEFLEPLTLILNHALEINDCIEEDPKNVC